MFWGGESRDEELFCSAWIYGPMYDMITSLYKVSA
jgi:hypothetical protein